MNKTVKILTTLLAVQILFAGAMLFKKHRAGGSGDEESLLRLKADDFDRVEISEPGKSPVAISMKGGKWVLPDRWDFPILYEKKMLTIDSLLGLKKTWPVGDTAPARKRFKVTEDSFEKKVVFMRDGKERKTLYVGTSPEYRKVHLRPSDRDEITLVEFGYHDLTMNPADWEDKKFLSINSATLMSLETPAVQLVNKETGFQVDPLKPGEESKASEVESLVSQITNLTYQELMGTTPSPDFGLDAPAYKVTLRTKDGQTMVYDFGKAKTGEDFYLKSSAHPFLFKIAKSTVDALKSVPRAKLITTKPS